MIHWIRPLWLWTLLPTALIWLALWRHRQSRQRSHWDAICDAHLLEHLLPQNTPRYRKQTLLWWLLGFTWLASILTLAGPSWTQQKQPTYHQQRGRVILMDLSPDMLATDLKPSRLARARFKLIDLLNHLHTGQVALIAFTQWPYLVSPLTQDTRTIISLVPQLQPSIMPTGGFNLTRALKKAKQVLQQAGADKGDIIIMTGHQPNASAWSTARSLAKSGFQSVVWGFGTASGGPIPNAQGGFDDKRNGQLRWSKLNIAQLQQFTHASEGHYVNFSNNNQDVKRVLSLTAPSKSDRFKKQSILLTLWQDQGAVFCWLIALLCLIILIRQPWEASS